MIDEIDILFPVTLQGVFKSRYPKLKGKAWVKTIEPDDLKAFVQIGQRHHQYGVLGGMARAMTARRDNKGRFV